MRGFLMLLGRGLFQLGLARWIIGLQSGRVRGVLYHAVDSVDTAYNRGLKLSVTPEALDRQLNYFSQYYQLARSSDNEKSKRPASLAISFDDGFSSVYHNAWSILQKYNAPASIFLVTCAVQQQLLWFNMLNWALHEHASIARRILVKHVSGPLPDSPRDCVIEVQEHSSPEVIEKLLEELAEALPIDKSHAHYLTPAQIREMRTAGVAFGFHTVNHYNLINCNTEELARQLDPSALSYLVSDRSFAYPFGYYSTDTLNAVTSRGYNPLMCVGFDNRHFHEQHVDRVQINHVEPADIFAQLEVAEPILALLRRWMKRETGRRSNCR